MEEDKPTHIDVSQVDKEDFVVDLYLDPTERRVYSIPAGVALPAQAYSGEHMWLAEVREAVTGDWLREYLADDDAGDLSQICAGYQGASWHGHNWRGTWTEEARALTEKYRWALSDALLYAPREYDATEWIYADLEGALEELLECESISEWANNTIEANAGVAELDRDELVQEMLEAVAHRRRDLAEELEYLKDVDRPLTPAEVRKQALLEAYESYLT